MRNIGSEIQLSENNSRLTKKDLKQSNEKDALGKKKDDIVKVGQRSIRGG